MGLFLGINDNHVGLLIQPVIINRLLDDIIGLKSMEWEEDLITNDLRTASISPLVPDNPRPPPPLAILVGKYFDEGYGSLELLTFKSSDHSLISDFVGGAVPEEYLEVIINAITTQPGLSEPVMYAHIGKLFGSVYVYSHFDGPVFNSTMMNVKKLPNGGLTAYIGYTSVAVFVAGQGMGMFQNFWGGQHYKTPVEYQVQEQAEVWFRKDERSM